MVSLLNTVRQVHVQTASEHEHSDVEATSSLDTYRVCVLARHKLHSLHLFVVELFRLHAQSERGNIGRLIHLSAVVP